MLERPAASRALVAVTPEPGPKSGPRSGPKSGPKSGPEPEPEPKDGAEPETGSGSDSKRGPPGRFGSPFGGLPPPHPPRARALVASDPAPLRAAPTFAADLPPAVVAGWHRRGRPLDVMLEEPAPPVPAPVSAPVPTPAPAAPPRSLGGTPAHRPGTGASSEKEMEPSSDSASGAADVPERTPLDEPDGPKSVSTALIVVAVPTGASEPGDAVPAVPDRTALGPSLPRRAGSFVRRWVRRVVSFVKGLPEKLGWRGAEADDD